MRIGIVHLSDVHFRKGSNPVIERAEHLARAISSADPTPTLYLIVVSGDIAFSGGAQEYEKAIEFFDQLSSWLRKLRDGVCVKYVSVPGNHDCLIPEKAIKLRDAVIQGAIPVLQDEDPDEALLNTLLAAQLAYEKFRKRISEPAVKPNEIAEVVLIEHEGRKIQVNLYNTALTSRRSERAAELHIPLKIIAQGITPASGAHLRISVFHHTYAWLHQDLALPFRSHVERTSDIALTGHQHLQHSFYKANSTGERVLYIESGALQDRDYPQTSAFQLLLFDFADGRQRSINYQWSGNIYKGIEDSDWREFALNQAIQGEFTPTDGFQAFLNDVGMPLSHRLKPTLKLRDVFVYPDLMVRGTGSKPTISEVRGADLMKYVDKTPRLLIQGAAVAGKTTLAKIIFADLLNSGTSVPIFLRGRQIQDASEKKATSQFWRSFQDQYGQIKLDAFRQLGADRRTLIIDDWHLSPLNSEGRKAFLRIAQNYFGKTILVTSDLFEIHEIVNTSVDTILTFETATIQEFRHVLRGNLIDRWLTLGREHTLQERLLARETEETERLVTSVIGKNTLPSTPFVLLCILQAEQEDKADVPEAGSFGYLYEVLVTNALNKSTGRKTQLEKKYVFLARMAYEMFKTGLNLLSEARIRELAEDYESSHLISIDLDSLLTDLQNARVLAETDGNFGFCYQHMFNYFVARYYKDGLGREGAEKLRKELSDMVDHIASDRHATILMFVLYFARDSAPLIHQLVANANKIFAGEPAAELGSDVDVLNQTPLEVPDGIPEKVDLDKNRKQRREMVDKVEKLAPAQPNAEKNYVYSEDLSDAQKLDLAHKHIELLGQVIRNFPGSLPGPEKLAILAATYLLGLRSLHVLLRLLVLSTDSLRNAMAEYLQESGKKPDEVVAEISSIAARLIAILSRIVAFGTIKKISASVGLADLEAAYKATLASVGASNATELIDLSIKLDHFLRFPNEEVKKLHRQLAKNSFAATVLRDLVMSHIQKFDVERGTRQSLSALFGVKANAPVLLDPSRKR